MRSNNFKKQTTININVPYTLNFIDNDSEKEIYCKK